MEFVYVVKRFDLFEDSFPHGFLRPWEVPLDEYIERIRDRGFFVERRQAEQDPTLKQVIPYSLLLRPTPPGPGDATGEGDGSPQVFLLRRTDGGGEARLFHLHSVGVGGHINPVDGDEDPLRAGLDREVLEEVSIEGEWSPEPLGIINDESQPVGAVHFGLVYAIHTQGSVAVRETDQLEGRWVDAATLSGMVSADRSAFETWSALILDRLGEALGPVGRRKPRES